MIDYTGKKYGRWTIISHAYDTGTQARWNCICECGTPKVVFIANIITGKSKSCGCLSKEVAVSFNTSHNMRHTKEYRAWSQAKNRCTNAKGHNYADYGGRGITFSPLWMNSFEQFFKDMGFAPSPAHSINRINNDGNYEAGNCEWSLKKEQANNTRRNRLLECNGKKMTIAQWAECTGVNSAAIHGRLKLGWSAEKALLTPINPKYMATRIEKGSSHA